ncbi:MAG: NAD(P)H-hydrate epimerase [Staphylococcus hominis]|nr:MAG: NAD(P)H-hydrate epimerase [Staphylococcus hominis]
MRAAEARAFASGIGQVELMDAAALAVAREAVRLARGPVLVLAGPGNNGGDGYGIARSLAEWGHDVAVAALGEPKDGAAAEMARRWTGRTIPLAEADGERPALVVDALFGTGVTRPLDEAVRAPLAALAGRAEVMAVDLPSGLATDSGEDLGGVPARMTVALGALKPAHALAIARCGHVVLAPIGLERWTAADVRSLQRPVMAAPGVEAHKYRALVTVLAGGMPGAARLAARGAVGAGAGYVVLLGDPDPAGPLDAVVHRRVDALAKTLEDAKGALLVGPGLGRDAEARERLEAVLGFARPLVLDGDALTSLGGDAAERLRKRGAATVLTPHSGEFDRMFGEGGGDKIARTRAAAEATGATVVHKGHATVVARPAGAVTVAAGASTWLASAGTGDVLAGAVAARVAAGGDPAEAVWLHAEAARLAGPAFAADGLAKLLPRAMAGCR